MRWIVRKPRVNDEQVSAIAVSLFLWKMLLASLVDQLENDAQELIKEWICQNIRYLSALGAIELQHDKGCASTMNRLKRHRVVLCTPD